MEAKKAKEAAANNSGKTTNIYNNKKQWVEIPSYSKKSHKASNPCNQEVKA
jgi:hypothetical protein